MAAEVADCAVVFLVGGESRRMGQPKAWLEFAGRPLLTHLVERMLTVFPEALVVAAPGQDLPETLARVVYDEQPGEGPLAGLAAGLQAVRLPLVFACSCDVPFLDPRLAAHLVSLAEGYDAVAPEWEGRLQPLHAVYRTAVHPILARQLAAGRRRATDLLHLVRTRIVSEEELRALVPGGHSFLNVNSPQDYAEALRLWPILTP